ncbi:MAG: MEDS domain-containing protein, partial [Candidatus Bathyarchaeota archaeon]
MSSYTNLAEELSEYGITRNQAKVYIAAAKLGTASISQISKTSNVPREEVYRLLPKLENLGLIEKTIERPMRVKASNIRTALSILVSREKEMLLGKISNLEQNSERILKNFQKLNNITKSSEKAHMTIIRQSDAISQKLVSMIEHAENTVSLTISREKFIHFFNQYRLEIMKALSRGIEFHVALERAEYNDTINDYSEEFEKSGRLEIRFVDQLRSHYILVDHKQALVSTSMKHTAFGNKAKMWTDDNSIMSVLKENFEIMWLTSEHINAMKKEDDDGLRTYLSNLLPTEHLALIHKTPESKYAVLGNYLKFGLENGESVIYISPEENQLQVRDVLNGFGIEVEKNEKAGALKIIPVNEFYIIDGKYNMSTTLDLAKKLYDDAIENGFKGCRIFGDSSCFFQNNLIEELIEFEKTLGRVLAIPIIGICPYDAEIFDKYDSPEEKIKELLKTHRKVLFIG